MTLDTMYAISIYVTILLAVLTMILALINNPLDFIMLLVFWSTLGLSIFLNHHIDSSIKELPYVATDKTQLDATININPIKDSHPSQLNITSNSNELVKNIVIDNKSTLIQINYNNDNFRCTADTPALYIYSQTTIDPMLNNPVNITIEKRTVLNNLPLIKERSYTVYTIKCQ